MREWGRESERTRERESTSDLSQKAESTTEQYRSVCRCCKTALISCLARSRDVLICSVSIPPMVLPLRGGEFRKADETRGQAAFSVLFDENSYQGPIKLSLLNVLAFENLHSRPAGIREQGQRR